jgi:nucleotide-binding universal stress UspA family protein
MKILVPVDGSKSSLEGARMAADLAKAKGAEVTLLAVVPAYSDNDLEITARARDSLEGKLNALATQAIDQAKGLLAGISLKSFVVNSNDIADEIIKMAEEEGFDLIVLGSRGRKPAGRFTVGGTALKVVSHSPCSVLVAKTAD